MNKLARLSLVASAALVPGYAIAMAPNTVEPPVAWEDVPRAELGASPQAGVTWQRGTAPLAMTGMPSAPRVQAAPPAKQAPAPAAEQIPQDDVQLAMAGRGGGRAMGGRVGGGAQMRGGMQMQRGPAIGGGRVQVQGGRSGGGFVAGGQFNGGRSGGGAHFNGGSNFSGGTHFSGGKGNGGRHVSFQRMHRGARMNNFWFGSRFRVNNWQVYGFAPPPPGWFWIRYYDDALLVDGNGFVQDYRGDMDWDRDGERWDYDAYGVPGYDDRGERYDDRDGEFQDEVYRGAPYAPYGYAGPIVVTETTTTTYAPAGRRMVEKRVVMKPHHVRRPYRDMAYDAPDCEEDSCDGPPPPPPPPPPPIPYGEKG